MIEKDCDIWKRLEWLNKIVMIEKVCNDWKIYACNKLNLVVI